MSVAHTLLMIIQIISAIVIIVLVLLQQGKGADMGSSFGGGSAGSLFGATGAANFLSRTTKWAAIVFFVMTAGLAYLGRPAANTSSGDVMENFQQSDHSIPTIPGTPPAAPAQGKDNSIPAAPPAAAPAPTPAPAAPASPAPAAPK